MYVGSAKSCPGCLEPKKTRSEGENPRYAAPEVCFAACEAYENAKEDEKDAELVKLAARYRL